MKYIKKRYRIFYIPLIFLSYFFGMLNTLVKFIYHGFIPEINDIEISIEGIEGDYHKIYKQRDNVYIGEKLKKDK
jgi:hypothetical protein